MDPSVSTSQCHCHPNAGQSVRALFALCLAVMLLSVVILASCHHHHEPGEKADCALCLFAHQSRSTGPIVPLVFTLFLATLPIPITPLLQVAPALRPIARRRSRAPPGELFPSK